MRRRQAHIFEKEKRGHYVEPAWCSRRLFEVESFGERPLIHDPACGWGTILHEALKFGYAVTGADIIDRKRHGLPGTLFFKHDFLDSSLDNISAAGTALKPDRIRETFASIVCNPPFDHVEEFCRRAVTIGATKVAMICLTRRLNAARWLQELPLRRVWLLTPRPSMPPGSWIAAGNKPGGGTQDFCWLVFERNYIGEPQIGWLHRDVQELREEQNDDPRAIPIHVPLLQA